MRRICYNVPKDQPPPTSLFLFAHKLPLLYYEQKIHRSLPFSILVGRPNFLQDFPHYTVDQKDLPT